MISEQRFAFVARENKEEKRENEIAVITRMKAMEKRPALFQWAVCRGKKVSISVPDLVKEEGEKRGGRIVQRELNSLPLDCEKRESQEELSAYEKEKKKKGKGSAVKPEFTAERKGDSLCEKKELVLARAGMSSTMRGKGGGKKKSFNYFSIKGEKKAIEKG